ncbi:succinyl-diaminopimelate desuccinylase [Notoacmeibacter ruber]|uniref:Succinyl-diaminopimelate desuccinylase n=1 Tax=Notoacmeibacter ruber TaxID=2670375 RepID=A0A3L7JFS4_9HYPH|nr:succinyl-diaminopimelate desuccinylase [Notoacmeibacter ruber]RLQ89314.1 succinyl-diaminopimelate desuccinylase [Notoacmeibacter ruber]
MTTTDPVAILAALIRCPSVTPEEGGALDLLQSLLSDQGFSVDRLPFQTEGRPKIDNLYASAGSGGPHLLFAGHTDVVPAGDEAAWSSPPFGAKVRDDVMVGRGAVDMKGGIAAFLAAYARCVEKHGRLKGKVSLLITGDEEGPALDGTVRVLDALDQRGEKFDACLVGEPTNPEMIGDMIKVGRRGSHTCTLTIRGTQGHVAYPHLADNPIRALVPMLNALMDPPLDQGSERFQPSNLEVTTVEIGNQATNVVPAEARAVFNIRFNDHWTAETLVEEIERRLAAAAKDTSLRPGREAIEWQTDWVPRVSEVFVTHDDHLIGTLMRAVESVTGRTPDLSTSGGTSDARFVKNYCPVVEFGLVGQTMHKIDEQVPLADLERLTRVYERFLTAWFAKESPS